MVSFIFIPLISVLQSVVFFFWRAFSLHLEIHIWYYRNHVLDHFCYRTYSQTSPVLCTSMLLLFSYVYNQMGGTSFFLSIGRIPCKCLGKNSWFKRRILWPLWVFLLASVMKPVLSLGLRSEGLSSQVLQAEERIKSLSLFLSAQSQRPSQHVNVGCTLHSTDAAWAVIGSALKS